MPKTKFNHFPNRPKKLTADFVKREYEKLLDRIPEAENSKTASMWLKLFVDWNELDSYIGSEGSRIHYKFSCRMNDKSLEQADRYYREKIRPVVRKPTHALMQAYIKSKHLNALSRRYGEQLKSVYEAALLPFDPINTKLRLQETKLENKYDVLKGNATVRFKGRSMTIARCGSYLQSPDEEDRRAAFLKIRQWYLKNRPKMSKIFDELVKVRTEMASNLSLDSYTKLAYQERGRTDYSRENVEKFRSLVKKYIVPLNRHVGDLQAKALGKNRLKPWDGYDPRTTLPMGIVPEESQLSTAEKLFNLLSPELGKLFSGLVKGNAIDLESRTGKETNPFCTSFPDTGKVVILCASTGNSSDVNTLIHESGHAFQGLISSKIEAVDLQWGTADLAEIPSIAMEYLSLPQIDLFFSGENADKYRLSQWEGPLSTLCYVCLVDEFQHWIYDNPIASADDRDNKWGQLAGEYLYRTDYRGYEKYENLRWYGQMHIFDIPFYYIDYALAETAAMQIAMIDAEDHKKAMEIYMELCRLGGTKSFLQALKHVGLRSPFDETLIKELAAHTKKALALV